MSRLTEKQEELLELNPGYKAAISRAKTALKGLEKHGVGIFASGSISFRPAKAMDPRFELEHMVDGCSNDGGDGGDEFPEFDELHGEFEEAGRD